ncbi:hypothetical protein Tco_0178200 [Tanacetum coccineum]
MLALPRFHTSSLINDSGSESFLRDLDLQQTISSAAVIKATCGGAYIQHSRDVDLSFQIPDALCHPSFEAGILLMVNFNTIAFDAGASAAHKPSFILKDIWQAFVVSLKPQLQVQRLWSVPYRNLIEVLYNCNSISETLAFQKKAQKSRYALSLHEDALFLSPRRLLSARQFVIVL